MVYLNFICKKIFFYNAKIIFKFNLYLIFGHFFTILQIIFNLNYSI